MEMWMWVVLAVAGVWGHGFSSGRKRGTRDVSEAAGLLRNFFVGK